MCELQKALKYNDYAFVWGGSGYKVRNLLLMLALDFASKGENVIFLTLSQTQREIIYRDLLKIKGKNNLLFVGEGKILFDTSTSKIYLDGDVLIVQYMNNFKNAGLSKLKLYEGKCNRKYYSGEAIGNTLFEERVCFLERINQVSYKKWDELHPTEIEKENLKTIESISNAVIPDYTRSINYCTWEYKEKRKKHPLDRIRNIYKHKKVNAPNFKYQNMNKSFYNQDHIKNLNSCGTCTHMKRYNCPTSYRNYPYENDFLCKKFDFLIENAGNIHIQKSPFPICDAFSPIDID